MGYLANDPMQLTYPLIKMSHVQQIPCYTQPVEVFQGMPNRILLGEAPPICAAF